MHKELFESVENNDEASVKRLTDQTDITTLKDSFGYSPLHRSITKGFDPISEILIEKGVDLNARDENGQTALHYAAFYDNLPIARILLNRGADLHIADNYGNQPLWTAVFNDKGFGRRLEMVKLFIDHNADIHHRNNVDKSPLDLATTCKYSDVVALLK